MKKIAMIIGGNFLIAAAATFFIEPSGFLSGGTTGIALFVKHVFHIPLSQTALVFDVSMLLLAWLILGKRLAMSALLSSLLYPLFLQLISLLPSIPQFTDPWLSVLFGGGMTGLGIGIVLRAGASSGGIDIPALILNDKLGIPVSVVLYSMDMVILAAQLLYSTIESLPYSILMVLVSSAMVNYAMVIGKDQVQATIISICPEIIAGRIQKELKRGVTYLEIETGYRHKETKAILCTLASREVPGLKQMMEEEDPQAFMTFVAAKEVRGRGFTLKKE